MTEDVHDPAKVLVVDRLVVRHVLEHAQLRQRYQTALSSLQMDLPKIRGCGPHRPRQSDSHEQRMALAGQMDRRRGQACHGRS